MLAACTKLTHLPGSASVKVQQVPEPHPTYLHALSGLCAVRHFLKRGLGVRTGARRGHPGPPRDRRRHPRDGSGLPRRRQDLNDRFPIDGHLMLQNRFAKANELLYAAHRDLPHAEDVPQSRGLRNRALMHVDQVHNTVGQAVKIARWQ